MHTTDLIQLIKTKPVTPIEVFNLLTDDLFEGNVSDEDLATDVSQRIIRAFRYQIMNVLVPVIIELKTARLK